MKTARTALAAALLLAATGSFVATGASAAPPSQGHPYGCTISPSACAQVQPTPFAPSQLPPTGGARIPVNSNDNAGWPLLVVLAFAGLLATTVVKRRLTLRRL